ncbi:MAG: polysaccharide deacetylase family protein [Planctomycetota bacterium]|nr:polysaccharide deacetylase family protein [Planctomycetota bacterium]
MIAIFIICIFAVVFLYIGVPWLYGRCLRLLLRRKAIRAKALVLTFDDGPGTRLTPVLLDILAENNVKATFFLLGNNIQGREAIVRQIAAGGHEICSHGYKHIHYWKVSPFQALTDIKKGWEAIDSAMRTQKTKYPFRPPYGKLNLVCLLYLLFRNVPIIYWTIDVRDTWAPRHHRTDRTASLVKKDGGAVTLAHDFDRSNSDVDDMVIKSIRSTLRAAKELGLRTLTVSQLLNDKK